MKFKSELVYKLPISLNEMYIRDFYEDLNIKEFLKKEVKTMDFDVEKVKSYYVDLLAKREEEREVKLADRERVVAEKLAEAERKIRETIDAELVAEVDAKYAHDIELCEKFFVDEVEEEPVLEDNIEKVGGEF